MAYKNIAKMFATSGFHPVLVDISWKGTTISTNVEHFLKKFKKSPASKKYILGFSYGAMIAFIAAAEVKVEGLILCSLSPYFSEDLKDLKNKNLSSLARLRYEDFAKFNSGSIAKKTRAKQILMIYGASEARALVARVKKTFDQINLSQKSLISIARTEHEIGSAKYMGTIREAAASLS